MRMVRTAKGGRLSLLSCMALVLVGQTLGAEPGLGRPLLSSQDQAGELAGWRSFHDDNARTGDVWKLTAEGVLICRGLPKGCLYTQAKYAHFVLELDWRWPKGQKPGNGGVLIRTAGEQRIWPKSLEAQLNAGNAGDFWGLAGYELSGPAERLKTLEHPQFGKLTNLKKTASAEKPAGQWNHYRIVADGPIVTLEINGQLVNRATNCDQEPGTICLTSEGNEIHFRNVRLLTLQRP